MAVHTTYAVNWEWTPGIEAYITWGGLASAHPYTPRLAEARRWQSRAGVERYLSRMDPTWASCAKVVECTDLEVE